MGFSRFSVLLAIRLFATFLAILVLGWLLLNPGYPVNTLLAALASLALGYEVFRFVSRTNQELSRFLDAVRYQDYGQRFDFSQNGAGFEELGETLTHILERFRDSRHEQEVQLRHLKALLEHVPVPLISIYTDSQVTLWNNAARRLFGSEQIARLADLEKFGADFFASISRIGPGERHLSNFHSDGISQRLMIVAGEITMASRTERLISLQNIQTELDGMQLSAWQDLVRVLTHEIMNSLTPVASLAKTAAELVDDASRRSQNAEVIEELKDARDAVATVARRSDGLMNFVSSYRQLTRPPTPEKTRFPISSLAADIERIISQDIPSTVTFNVDVAPAELELFADRQLIEQVLINLIQNALHALAGRESGTITLQASLNRRGLVIVEVRDDGPGIPPEVATRVFVPFYTTRREGSGVGLALSRQIMVAHGGSISFENQPGGGARFSLVF